MAKKEHYDLIVIGSSAGLTVASMAHGQGAIAAGQRARRRCLPSTPTMTTDSGGNP